MHFSRSRVELLNRVVRAGRADAFRLVEVCPLDASRFDVALDSLVEGGHAERVNVRVGVWYYRLTPKGIEAQRTGVVTLPTRFERDD